MSAHHRFFSVVAALLVCGIVSPPSASAQTVMALGNSVTVGEPIPPGYRALLFNKLKADGFTIDNVGSIGIGPTGPTLTDLAHEGHPGYTISRIQALRCGLRTQPSYLINCAAGRSGDSPWKAFAPAVTLLMIGTNDFRAWDWNAPNAGQTIAARLDQLIAAVQPTAVDLFVATIPPIPCGEIRQGRCSNTWFSPAPNKPVDQQTIDEQIRIYNQHILELDSAFSNVFPVDTALALSDIGGDLLHPNSVGYQKIATAWLNEVEAVLREPRLAGDLNRDGRVDVDDLSILTSALNHDFPLRNDPRDLDADGKVTVLDARLLVNQCTEPLCR